MRIATIQYENIVIELTRPTISDGYVRKEIAKRLAELVKAPAAYTANVFVYFITQIVKCENYDFIKMEFCPPDEELMEVFGRFERETDEMLLMKIEDTVVELNGIRERAEQKKTQSAPSSNSTSEVAKTTPTL